MTSSDGRLRRGTRTRQMIVRHAVDMASLDGLGAMSIGRIATGLGLSKSGVQTLFGTKEKLQLAAVETARKAFLDAVVRPTDGHTPGADRLRALIDQWIRYVTVPLFPGGCFRAANVAEFDSKPGPVRDALFRDQRDWQNLLAGELRTAVEAGEIQELDADLAAFQLDAVLCAANTALRLGDEDAVDKVRRVVAGLLKAP
ncbi:TetR/AcrR family transcriptional regulator [Amycolatopsis sp. 195334CR]|uniref:TetR/AcrR family transcriptional regulator n=1 Tax=Amycolatopsis sp. 195334CR TaxID=2814588 RepID=UPI001A8E6B62|nr:TetR/AcrR family transcriptional regulator [Amycolatopsis sp. 195334CR]MBN6039452.1 TetR/AcrR family transcriptional regulator [Amycolatopsis sp. 195334CR]